MNREVDTAFQRARQLFEVSDYPGVVKAIGRLTQTAQQQTGLARLLAVSYSHIGRHDLALQWAEKALVENPQDTEISGLVSTIRGVFGSDEKKEGKRLSPWGSALPMEALRQIQSGLHRVKYRGIEMLKNPFDIAIYMQLLWDLKPGTVFEIGTHSGGTAIWLGDQLINYGLPGRVISIDLIQPAAIEHSRVQLLEGDATALAEALDPELLQSSPHPWLVIEDSSHEVITSEAVWRFFHPFLTPGDYLVVEDGIISDLFPEAYPNFSSGPHIAIGRLLGEFPDVYEVDRHYCDFFGHNFTWCTNGFLRRK
jgi:cephalosporin hydroxylase